MAEVVISLLSVGHRYFGTLYSHFYSKIVSSHGEIFKVKAGEGRVTSFVKVKVIEMNMYMYFQSLTLPEGGV